MATLLSCPTCGGELQVPDTLLGQRVRCPTCRGIFQTSPEGSAARPDASPPVQPDAASPEVVAGETGLESEGPPPSARVLDDPRGDSVACPYCAEMIPRQALHCPFCGERIDPRGRWMRRDVDPHRGATILVLGIVSLVCGVGILFCQLFNIVGIGLGAAAWIMGNHDLARISRGEMDPEGQRQTKSGRNCGIIGVIVNILCILACVGLFAVIILAQGRGRRW